jgi:NTE family protein
MTMERIALALQGGGTHCGFVWGVLDRLSHECELAISAISSSSSGALTAAA